jgi:hypothetical protein
MRSTILALGVLAAAWSAVDPVAAQRATREQRVDVSVMDRNEKPVPDLAVADFTVREDGVAREVLRVEHASDPLQIMLLADTSDGIRVMLPDLRAGLKAFARRVWEGRPGSEIGVMEFGERPVMMADKATSPALLDRVIDRLNEHPQSGAYGLDAIVDAAKNLKKREAAHGAIVVFSKASSPEFSTRDAREIQSVLKDARVSLWSASLQDAPPPMSHEGQQRDQTLGDVSPYSGGLRIAVLDKMGIEKTLTMLGTLLASEYTLVYARPDALIPPTKLEVTSKRSGTRTAFPRWPAQ